MKEESRSQSQEETVFLQAKRPRVGNNQHRYLQRYQHHGEIVWLFKIEDTTEVRERCIRLFALIAKRSAKSPSNPEKIVRCIAGTVFPSTKIAVVRKRKRDSLPSRELVWKLGETFEFSTWLPETDGMGFRVEQQALAKQGLHCDIDRYLSEKLKYPE